MSLVIVDTKQMFDGWMDGWMDEKKKENSVTVITAIHKPLLLSSWQK